VPDLPHAYPFRFVEPPEQDQAPTLAPSAGDALPWRGEPRAPYPLSLAVEAMAQAALAAVPAEREEEAAGRVFLAGIENARLVAEIHAGDRLEASAELQGRFGPAVKVRCRLKRPSSDSAGAGATVAEATLLLALEPAGPRG
jgi:3-hydroxymyristoyl/3-hydroxydecanoyl-(acyl carrier protein) dehydratase